MIVGGERGIVNRKNDGLRWMVVCFASLLEIIILQDDTCRATRTDQCISIWSARPAKGSSQLAFFLLRHLFACLPAGMTRHVTSGTAISQNPSRDVALDPSVLRSRLIFRLQHPPRHRLTSKKGRVNGSLACLHARPLAFSHPRIAVKSGSTRS